MQDAKNTNVEAALAAILEKNAPMTIVRSKFPPELVDAFRSKMLARKSKHISDQVYAFIGGKAGSRKCIWTKPFVADACEHFGVTKFEDFFTTEGKKGQELAMEIVRQRNQRDEVVKRAPESAKKIMALMFQAYKRADKFGAKLEPFRNGVKLTMPSKAGVLTFTVNSKGIREVKSDV